MIRLADVTPAKLGFARRFVEAGWGLPWAAHLFNLDPEALAAALDREAA